MKASEVIELYNAGERDFSGKRLRGQNFTGKDLSGANFSKCDIRGTKFKEANLTGANFTQATAGLQKRWVIGLLLVALLLIVLSSFGFGFTGYLVGLISDGSSDETQTIGWTSLITLLIFYIFSYFRGLVGGLKAIALFVAITGVFITFLFAVVVFVSVVEADVEAEAMNIFHVGAFSFIITFIGALPFVGACVVVGAVASAVFVAGAIAVTVAVVIALVSAISVGVVITFSEAGAVAGAIAFAVAVALTLFASYLAYRSMKGDPREAWIRTFAVAFAATGGTTFRNANLTDANFTQARLKSTDFREAILTRTCFKNTEKLDRVRPRKTLLSQPNVRDLLITGYGYKKNYQAANLRGANLEGVNLNQANLKQCDLSEATLKVANLEGANLTEVSALKTDFTRCNLTGACLEAWNIDNTTILEQVDCQYVFLLEKENKKGSKERRPHDPDKVFQPGDFEQLYSKIINTVQLLLRNGVNSDAFKIAFQKIMAENPGITYNSIQGIEKKGQDVLVTLEVPEDADKGNIEHTFNEAYEARLESVRKVAFLEGKLESKTEETGNLTEILKSFSSEINLINNNTNTAMNHSSDSSQNINIRDINANQSIVNLGDISGKVANNIQQLPDNSEDGKTNLKHLLTQLQAAIETEESLNDIQKAEALEAAESLTQAAIDPKDSNLKKLAKLSKNALMGIAANLPNATTLVQEFNKLLPAITQLLGL